MRILVIEDDERTAKYLKQGLEENAFAVDLACNGMDGLHLATHEDYDLIILDIMLPEYDGETILRKTREKGINTPVIFLTAKDTTYDKVKGLDMGADDYVAKPFSFTELLARIRACLRRTRGEGYSILKVEDLTLDPIAIKVFRNNQKTELTPVEFSMLEYLMQNTGKVVTRTMISEHVWDTNFESFSNVVDVHISKLRTKIDKDFDKKLIHTVRSVGYVLEKQD
ncbi:MAG: heavy metal response regulator transcription factor [Candidatus Anammoxibacter sp.]